jgi:hypothetical protein
MTVCAVARRMHADQGTLMSTTAVNLQSARARGTAVPNSIQLLANEVIE